MQFGDQLRPELINRWQELEAGELPAASSLRTLDIPVDTPHGTALLGFGSDGRRLLVPLPPKDHRQFKEDRRSTAIHVLKRQVEREDGLRWYADLVCRQPRLLDVFTSLTADAVLRISSRPDDAVAALRRCLADWRALFASGERLLSIRELAGLFGELLVLQRLLEQNGACVGLWRGPLREFHDFSDGTNAVEVKTSMADDGYLFHVHGFGQLEPPADGELQLCHIRLTQALEDGQTVPDLVAVCNALSNGGLGGKLEAIGYRAAQEESYGKVAFQVLEQSWYEVTDGFPRLVGSSFVGGDPPEGVGSVTYEVDLAEVDVNPLGDEPVETHLARMLDAA